VADAAARCSVFGATRCVRLAAAARLPGLCASNVAGRYVPESNACLVLAFILAAGEGSRLRPLTDRVPKPMIEIGGRPILEHNVRMLQRFGVREIVINLHHRGEAIQTYFGDGARFGVHISYSLEPELLGTAGALNPVRARLTEPFFLLYGDNLTTCDLGALRARLNGDALAALALFERDDVSQSGVVALDGEDRIVRFIEKPAGGAPSHWVSAGLVAFAPGILEFVPERGASDFGRDVFPAALAAGKRLNGYRMSEKLWWIDSPADYERTAADPALALLG
jgi:mannose-1-phosphate guanylyltransferase